MGNRNKKKVYVLLASLGIIAIAVSIFKMYHFIRINEKYFQVDFNEVVKITVNSDEIIDEELKKDIISAYNNLKNVDIDAKGQIGTPDCTIRIYLRNNTVIAIDEYITIYIHKNEETYCFNAKSRYLRDLMTEYTKQELHVQHGYLHRQTVQTMKQ